MKKLHEIIPATVWGAFAHIPNKTEQSSWNAKQNVLVSGTNIKTINGSSILGSGDMSVGGGTFSGTMDDIPDGTTYVKSHNDYTDAEQTKLSGIATGAEVNVNADWNAGSGDAQILNKPTIITLLDVYPVGSIYISVSGTSPATLFGGTWVAFGAGKVLVGINPAETEFDTVEETGGEKTHTLTTTEIPAHQHVIPDVRSATTGTATTLIARTSDTSSTVGADVKTASDGGSGGAHNNLQPYVVVYMFKRTA